MKVGAYRWRSPDTHRLTRWHFWEPDGRGRMLCGVRVPKHVYGGVDRGADLLQTAIIDAWHRDLTRDGVYRSVRGRTLLHPIWLDRMPDGPICGTCVHHLTKEVLNDESSAA